MVAQLWQRRITQNYEIVSARSRPAGPFKMINKIKQLKTKYIKYRCKKGKHKLSIQREFSSPLAEYQYDVCIHCGYSKFIGTKTHQN